MESVCMYIVVRGSDHYAPPTREVRGNYSNDGINHVSPQEAFIIIEILAPPSSPPSSPFLSFPFLRSPSTFSVHSFPRFTLLLVQAILCSSNSYIHLLETTPRNTNSRMPFIKKSSSATRGNVNFLLPFSRWRARKYRDWQTAKMREFLVSLERLSSACSLKISLMTMGSVSITLNRRCCAFFLMSPWLIDDVINYGNDSVALGNFTSARKISRPRRAALYIRIRCVSISSLTRCQVLPSHGHGTAKHDCPPNQWIIARLSQRYFIHLPASPPFVIPFNV